MIRRTDPVIRRTDPVIPYPMTILQQDVTSRDVLPVHLAPGGGFAIRIDKRD